MSENLRIGVFVCDCGSNIAGPVDTETVRAVRRWPARCGCRGAEQVHLCRTRSAGDPPGDPRAQSQPGGGGFLLTRLV